MISLTESAREKLDQYIEQIRGYLSGCGGVDAEEVERDVREHIEHELESKPVPVSESALSEVLGRLGAPWQWVPPEEQPWWRRLLMGLNSGPEDFRLAYISFALFLLSLLWWHLTPVALLGSFIAARAALAFDPATKKMSRQRWLIYPPLIFAYAMLLAVLLLWPAGVVAALADRFHAYGYSRLRTGRIDPQMAYWILLCTIGIALSGIWCVIFGLSSLRFTSALRSIFRPFVQRRRAPWIVIITGAISAAVCGAGVFGFEHWNNSRPVDEFTMLMRDAGTGDANAMYEIGMDYQSGRLVGLDVVKGRQWLEDAAKAGNGKAMVRLGDMYEIGIAGVGIDYSKSLDWYHKAAQEGNADAMFKIGAIYEDAKGVPRDGSRASSWYLNAAKLGNASAMERLGSTAAPDEREALAWHRKAADAGNTAAMRSLYWHYSDDLKDRPEEMLWLHRAADAGDGAAMLYLGHIYAQGDGVTKDYGEAMSWYRKSADAGVTYAMCCVGDYYRDGLGVKLDYAAAASWYRKAAEMGSARAMDRLADCYRYGWGVTKDYHEAMYWYLKTTNTPVRAGYRSHLTLARIDLLEDSKRAMLSIGCMYLKGEGVDKGAHQAVSWFIKGSDANQGSTNGSMNSGIMKDWLIELANSGSSDAMYAIGFLYEKNEWVDSDPDGAAKWMKKAADAGDEYAKKWLAEHPKEK